MTTNDIQQAVSGFKTVGIVPGAMVVRVHEALDAGYAHTPHRYFISVDFKFRKSDALNVGSIGALGCTKAEATREANALAARINTCRTALDTAKELAAKWDTFTNRYTVKMQEQTWDKIIGRYCAEFV